MNGESMMSMRVRGAGAACALRRARAAGALAASILGALCLAAPVAAQQAPGGQPPSTVNEKDFIVMPPGKVDPGLVKPAPPDRDPGLVEKPPADAKGIRPGGAREAPPPAPPERSRQDDCRGATEDCKQSSPR